MSAYHGESRPDTQNSEAESAQTTHPRNEKLGTILLVEDDRNDMALIQRAFEREVANPIQHVENGVHATAYLMGTAISRELNYGDRCKYPVPILILLDLKMPQMGGLELLRWLRLQRDLKRIPVIVLTESVDSSSINAAYELGANSYLIKPGKREDILRLVKSIGDYWLTLNESPHLILRAEVA